MTDEVYETVCPASDRAAWLQARTTGIGASESPVLLGASSFSSPVTLWGEKTGRLPVDETDENERMLWGQRLEPLVAEEYERRTKRGLIPWGDLLRSTRLPFMVATPDYATIEGIPVEIKTTDGSRVRDWREGPPAHVAIQCQHQMFVTGARMASVGVLVGGNRFMWADVPRDDDLIAEIVETCAEFWRLVREDVPPPADASDATHEAIAAMWPKTAIGESLVLPPESYDWARELEAAEAERKLAGDRAESIKNTVRLAMGAAEVGVFPDGERAFTLRTQKRSGYTVAPAEFRVLRRTKS